MGKNKSNKNIVIISTVILLLIAGFVIGLYIHYGGEGSACEIQDCEVNPWSEWSACTRICGPGGTRFRTRNVTKPSACVGNPCPGILTEVEECNGICYNNGTLDKVGSCTCPPGYNGQCCECKIQDCVMTPWSDWSVCSHTCGPNGTTFRTRIVQNAPRCGGTECSAIFTEHKPCNRMCYNDGLLDNDSGECKCMDGFSGQCCQCENVDCELSKWTEWSTCENATRQVRSRDVIRQPKCAGRACEGPLTEDRSCAHQQQLLVTILGPFLLLVVIGLVIIIIIFTRRKTTRDTTNSQPQTSYNNNMPEKQENLESSATEKRTQDHIT